METKNCIYCGRTFDVDRLLEKAGTYRCKDENDCLEYQAGEDPADSIEDADYISAVVKSSLAEATRRIAAYKDAKKDQSKSSMGDRVEISQESIDEFTWMKSAVEALALEYKENKKFVFQYHEPKDREYTISFNDPDHPLHIAVRIDPRDGSSYSLIAARGETADNTDPLYREFIYKSYPGSQREDLIQDLSVILIALDGEKELISGLLNEFRMEIETRYYHSDE